MVTAIARGRREVASPNAISLVHSGLSLRRGARSPSNRTSALETMLAVFTLATLQLFPLAPLSARRGVTADADAGGWKTLSSPLDRLLNFFGSNHPFIDAYGQIVSAIRGRGFLEKTPLRFPVSTPEPPSFFSAGSGRLETRSREAFRTVPWDDEQCNSTRETHATTRSVFEPGALVPSRGV